MHTHTHIYRYISIYIYIYLYVYTCWIGKGNGHDDKPHKPLELGLFPQTNPVPLQTLCWVLPSISQENVRLSQSEDTVEGLCGFCYWAGSFPVLFFKGSSICQSGPTSLLIWSPMSSEWSNSMSDHIRDTILNDFAFSLETRWPGDHSAQDIMSDSGLPHRREPTARNLFWRAGAKERTVKPGQSSNVLGSPLQRLHHFKYLQVLQILASQWAAQAGPHGWQMIAVWFVDVCWCVASVGHKMSQIQQNAKVRQSKSKPLSEATLKRKLNEFSNLMPREEGNKIGEQCIGCVGIC